MLGVLGSLWWLRLIGALSSWGSQSHGRDRLETKQLQLRVVKVLMQDIQAFGGVQMRHLAQSGDQGRLLRAGAIEVET